MKDNDALKQYLEEISKCTPLDSNEEADLFRRLSEGQGAEKRLIESKLQLVVTIAERYRSSGMPLFHLIQEGNVGLMKAVKTFTESRSRNFTEYATGLIEKMIQFGIAEHKRDAEEGKK